MARILIVDDNADISLLVSIVLESAGHAPIRAASGAEALTTIESTAPDLVILDVQMADMDGWQTLTKIRKNDAHLPVFMCTVKASEGDVVHGWELGCDGYLTKPFDIQSLVDEVTTVLGRSAEERHRRRAHGVAAGPSAGSTV